MSLDKKTGPRLHIVLAEPRIPQNTGNISRTCAVTGAEYESLDDFFSKNSGDMFLFTTKGRKVHSDAVYDINKDTYLIFGREDKGLPEKLLYDNPDKCVRIPMRKTLRSLNLSNSVAIAAYEVLRQWGYPELSTKGQLTQYTWQNNGEDTL